MTPTTFDRVGVGRVTRKSKCFNSVLPCKEISNNMRSMDRSTIPNQLDRGGNMFAKASKKINNQLPIEIVVDRKHLKEESLLLCFWTDGDCTDGRNFSSLVPRRQLRRLPTRRQRPSSGGHQLKTGFINVYQGRPFIFSFFLISGSSSDSHCSTLLGSRSRATFSGR